MHCLLVGAGAIASEYASGLATSSVSVAGVCDLDSERAMALAEDIGCPWFTNLDRALEAVDAPLVVNLTSHAAHAPVTRTALQADRHVYSQKPLALDTETAEALVSLAQNRDLALGCAPENQHGPSQRLAAEVLADGRLGRVQLGYAHAHVGRVTDWHDRPGSFLEVGPLYDGGTYPLTLLVSWFGPVKRVRTAETLDIWPEHAQQRPCGPSHVEAMIEFDSGPTVRLTASFYAPHRSREFYGLELHGDDGSLYLEGTGALDAAVDRVKFGRIGRQYTAVPPQSPPTPTNYADAVERLAESVRTDSPGRETGRRAAHVVAVCSAIEDTASSGAPVAVPDFGVRPQPLPDPTVRPPEHCEQHERSRTLRLPAIGFGCSRYRDGEYVDRRGSIAEALDAGYRFLDSAELYGNEHRIGKLLSAPGAPDRDSLFLLGKVWRTNHRREHMIEAAAGSLSELGIEAFDCYALHWPEAWQHQGPLTRLADRPVAEQERLTFPEVGDGAIETAEIPLEQAWQNLEVIYNRGLARTIGVSNVTKPQLEAIIETGEIQPALVQIERHPYKPQHELVSFCHERGIRVVAHSPLSAPGLIEERILAEIGDEHGLSPAGVVLAWNATQHVVPIPSSTTLSHIVSNLAAAGHRLRPAEIERIASLRKPDFER
jgi:alcohol dehydrogenase (NADP+)